MVSTHALRDSCPYKIKIMLKNYFKIAVRSLFKNKLYSFINILGLALGMAICILVFLFIRHEISYDTCYKNSENIHRIIAAFTSPEKTEWLALTPYPIASMVREELPEVEASTIISSPWSETLFQANDHTFYSDQYARIDTAFFQVFSFSFLAGNPSTVLQDPSNIVISEKMATRLFGKEDAMGKTIRFDNDKDYQVAGIFKSPKTPTHFAYNMYLPWHKKEIQNYEWTGMFNYHTYAKLKPESKITSFNENLNSIFRKRLAGILGDNAQNPEMAAHLNSIALGSQPIQDIHLKSHLDGEINPNSFMSYLYIYGLVAFIMLMIAAINFMNMSTARSANRAKEVGVRKVVGASRWNTSSQFLIESMLQTFIALVLGFIIAEFMLPSFNLMMKLDLRIFESGVTQIITIASLFAIITGLLAGSYPAFFLSGFQPIKVLKGDFSKSKESAPLRKGLVIFQFMICSALIFFLLIVINQIDFMTQKELGFHPEQVLIVPIQTREIAENPDALKNRLGSIPNVESISIVNSLPGQQMGGNGYALNGKEDILAFNLVDEDFLNVLEIPLTQGRFFTKQDLQDTIQNFVVNEAFIQHYEVEDDPIGQIVRGGNGDGQIIGVVKNFHWKGVNEKIDPFVMQELQAWSLKAAIRIKSTDVSETIQKIRGEWFNFEPKHPMRYTFLDEDFGTLFTSYENFGRALSYITLLIIFTAILGLFGLATYMGEQRIKEIGIRKVLGASIPQIMFLMVKDFIRLVLIAGIIALPLGYWIAQQWLQDFAYQLPLGVTPFFLSLALILIVSILTVSIQAFRASSANPINAIKCE